MNNKKWWKIISISICWFIQIHWLGLHPAIRSRFLMALTSAHGAGVRVFRGSVVPDGRHQPGIWLRCTGLPSWSFYGHWPSRILFTVVYSFGHVTNVWLLYGWLWLPIFTSSGPGNAKCSAGVAADEVCSNSNWLGAPMDDTIWS